jgi:hypothetical protein
VADLKKKVSGFPHNITFPQNIPPSKRTLKDEKDVTHPSLLKIGLRFFFFILQFYYPITLSIALRPNDDTKYFICLVLIVWLSSKHNIETLFIEPAKKNCNDIH